MAVKLNFSDLGDAPETAPPTEGGGKPATKTNYDVLQDLYGAQSGKYEKQVYDAEPLNYDSGQTVTLSNGKYRGLKVPVGMVKDMYAAAKKAGIDPYILMGLAGQESTFGAPTTNSRSFTRRDVVSGWNLDDRYKPINPDQFLEQSGVPGVKAKKTFHGYEYTVTDKAALEQALAKNPKLIDKYKQLLAQKNLPSDYNSFYEAAQYLKKRGIKAYNPGDKRYVSMVQHSIDLLRSDPSLTHLLSSFGKS